MTSPSPSTGTSTDAAHGTAPGSAPVWILGAGPGLGLALALAFGRTGRPVVLMARSQDRLEGLVERCAAEGVQATAIGVDLADADGLRAALQEADRRTGPCAVLVHNASILVEGTPSVVDPAAVEHGLRVGAGSAVIALQHVLPAMRSVGSGRILLTGGGTAIEPWVGGVGLSMQKAALRSLALATARELHDGPVRCTTVTIMGAIGAHGLEPDTIAALYVDAAQQSDPPEEITVGPA
jgi:NAD(P)-dependent dehydrogenase (short-subunit alcohol dehydrogenase family)